MSSKLNSRPPIERMAFVSRMLQNGERFTTQKVADYFEVNPRTITRDIEFMRDRLGYKIQFIQEGSQEEWTFTGEPPPERVL